MFRDSTSTRQNHGSNTAKLAKMNSLHVSCELVRNSDWMLLCARPVVRTNVACQQKATMTRSARDGHMVLNGDARHFNSRYSTPHDHTNESVSSGRITRSRTSVCSSCYFPQYGRMPAAAPSEVFDLKAEQCKTPDGVHGGRSFATASSVSEMLNIGSERRLKLMPPLSC